MRTGTRLLAAGFGILIAGAAAFGFTGPVQMHNYLVKSTPSANEVLTTLPSKFSVITNDILPNLDGKANGFALEVKDAAGLFYGDGCITVDGPGISTPAALGAPGKYTALWQVISTDGHLVSNQFTFTWQPPADFTPSAGSKTPPDCHGTHKVSSATEGAPAPSAPTAATDSGVLSTVLWIGGAIVAVAIAVVVTLLLLTRKKKE